MTKENLKQRFKELMMANPPLNEIEKLFNQALNSGALDFEKDVELDYRVAKNIYHAILCTMANKWNSIVPANKKASRNLQRLFKQYAED